MSLYTSAAHEHLYHHEAKGNKTFEIPQGVTNIPLAAHMSNFRLAYVDMRRAYELVNIGERAFHQCKGLLRVFFAPNSQVVQAGAFAFCEQLHTVGFENVVNLKEIGANAFDSCISLTEISLPSTIATLGEAVFCQCHKLQKVRLPTKLHAIPSNAFLRCVGLHEINLESTMISKIGESAFESCELLSMIVFSSNLETIAANAFVGCTSLRIVDMTQSVRLKTIGEEAFVGCNALSWLDFSHTILEKIEEGAFKECRSLRQIELNAELSEIESNVFAYCVALQTVAFHPSGRLNFIGPYAFTKCSALHQLEFPSSVESIDCEAFSWCSNLNSVQFQQGLKCIAEDAFFGCESLTDITVPSSVDYLMEESFDGEYLERVDIQGDRLELSIRLWRMYPNAFVRLPEEKWCYLYCHDGKKFCSTMTKKDLQKLDWVKGLFANKLHNLIHWSVSVVGPPFKMSERIDIQDNENGHVDRYFR